MRTRREEGINLWCRIIAKHFAEWDQRAPLTDAERQANLDAFLDSLGDDP